MVMKLIIQCCKAAKSIRHLRLAILAMAFFFGYVTDSVKAVSGGNENLVKAKLDVDVYSRTNNESISGSRIIVIDRNGAMLSNGFTDSKGIFSTNIEAEKDQRFSSMNMALVTVIAIADGFNEHIIFDLPVNEHGTESGKAVIKLSPINPDWRNEPTFELWSFHRFTVFGMLDDYAKKLGLHRQKPIKGIANEEMPWSTK
jgi:hypothetical protein